MTGEGYRGGGELGHVEVGGRVRGEEVPASKIKLFPLAANTKKMTPLRSPLIIGNYDNRPIGSSSVVSHGVLSSPTLLSLLFSPCFVFVFVSLRHRPLFALCPSLCP